MNWSWILNSTILLNRTIWLIDKNILYQIPNYDLILAWYSLFIFFWFDFIVIQFVKNNTICYKWIGHKLWKKLICPLHTCITANSINYTFHSLYIHIWYRYLTKSTCNSCIYTSKHYNCQMLVELLFYFSFKKKCF